MKMLPTGKLYYKCSFTLYEISYTPYSNVLASNALLIKLTAQYLRLTVFYTLSTTKLSKFFNTCTMLLGLNTLRLINPLQKWSEYDLFP